MSELLCRSLAIKMEESNGREAPLAHEDAAEALSVRDASGPLLKSSGWAAFWVATLLENLGTILVGIIYPDLAVAALNDGVDICAGTGAASPQCQEALAKASGAFGLFGLVGGILSFFCIPVVGTAADHFGRRPLLIFSFLCSKVPTLTLLCVAYLNISIYCFFAAIMIPALVPSTMLFWFWINDNTTKEERVRMFGRLAAFSNLEGIVTPFAVFLVHGKHAVLLLVAIRLSAVLTVICFVPESRPPARRGRFMAEGRLAFLSRWQGVSKLCSDPSLRAFLALAFVASGTGAGLQAVMVLYLKAKFGLEMKGIAPFVSVSTLSNFAVQLGLIPVLSRHLELRGVFALGLLSGAVIWLGVILAPSPPWTMLPFALAGLGNVGTPAIQALMSNLSESIPGMTPGVALGALQAVQSLIMIVMPPAFQGLFSVAVRSVSFLSMPFLVGVVLNLGCLVLLCCLPKSFFVRAERG